MTFRIMNPIEIAVNRDPEVQVVLKQIEAAIIEHLDDENPSDSLFFNSEDSEEAAALERGQWSLMSDYLCSLGYKTAFYLKDIAGIDIQGFAPYDLERITTGTSEKDTPDYLYYLDD